MVEQSKGTARPPPWVAFRKDSSELTPSKAPNWQFLPAKRDAHVMPETNRQRLQVLAQPAGKTAGWIDRPDHVQQDDQGVVYLIAVFAVGKGDPQAGGLLPGKG